MSYILDALRKADAERRGVPPPQGMTEPAVLVATDADADGDGEGAPARARPWIWLLAGVGLALVVALVWNLWLGVPATPPVAAVAPPAVAVAPPPVAAPPVAAPEPPQAAPPEPETLPRFPPPLPEAPKAETRPPNDSKPAAKGPPPPGITEVLPARAPAGADRVQKVSELPEAVRRDLPRLTISGAMYSERVADRMVVINGQVFHEGDAIGREVTLRQIRLKSAVVEFRGHRIELGY